MTHFPEEQQIIESRGYTGIFDCANHIKKSLVSFHVPFVTYGSMNYLHTAYDLGLCPYDMSHWNLDPVLCFGINGDKEPSIKFIVPDKWRSFVSDTVKAYGKENTVFCSKIPYLNELSGVLTSEKDIIDPFDPLHKSEVMKLLRDDEVGKLLGHVFADELLEGMDGTRDSVLEYLTPVIGKLNAYRVMEAIRKGLGLSDQQKSMLVRNGVKEGIICYLNDQKYLMLRGDVVILSNILYLLSKEKEKSND